MVHTEKFHDVNTKGEVKSFVDTNDGRRCEHEKDFVYS